jgi:hypothetical protein
MKKYDILIIYNNIYSKREIRKCYYITYLLLKLRFLFSKVEVIKI